MVSGANPNQYLLILAMVFASCTILLVHVFVFPLYDTKWNSGSLDSWNGTSILLPRFVVMPDLVLTWVQDIRREFKFKPKLYESAQNILRNFGQSYGNDTQNLTYIGVHVRRTDYKGYLWRTRKMNLADAAYFHRAMDYFREKYKHVAFVIVSDESAWCIEHLSANDVTVIRSRTTSPGLDLALMANCNHSIIDYGTFGVWGAILAGGETVLNFKHRSCPNDENAILSQSSCFSLRLEQCEDIAFPDRSLHVPDDLPALFADKLNFDLCTLTLRATVKVDITVSKLVSYQTLSQRNTIHLTFNFELDHDILEFDFCPIDDEDERRVCTPYSAARASAVQHPTLMVTMVTQKPWASFIECRTRNVVWLVTPRTHRS
ncbi:hypothetical protein B566_EDAN008165 [Ephemera danica]|nr:hypothetical protein B566_EDAN008165 [Ephemera danica]